MTAQKTTINSEFHAWTPTPPMGWNSWDCFATTVTEAQTKANADVMARKLKQHGWQYIVVDIQWYEPNATGFPYRPGAELVMDEWGRLAPAENRFPSAADGAGFKPLARYVHDLGLRFGIHLLRGIPRQAVRENTPILGTQFHARDIADTNRICNWNDDMYGVDMTKPGAQEYYDSVFALIASWDVDYVKVDDLGHPYHKLEVEAIRKAIDATNRPIVFSVSPGDPPLEEGGHLGSQANLWRISADFWDNWPALRSQFKRIHDWNPFLGSGRYPDADMLPLGAIRQVPCPAEWGPQHTQFTADEQRTMMSLWCMARSPLMMGGDLAKLDAATLALLTNDDVLAIDQHSRGNHQFLDRDGLVGWRAEAEAAAGSYIGIFNTTDAPAIFPMKPADLGFEGSIRIKDLWAKGESDIPAGETLPIPLPPHGCVLYRLSAD